MPAPTVTAKYQETHAQQEQREKAFVFHPPKEGQPLRYVAIRDKAHELAELMNAQCPYSRELSLAMTKLEEAIMWANAAIARNE